MLTNNLVSFEQPDPGLVMAVQSKDKTQLLFSVMTNLIFLLDLIHKPDTGRTRVQVILLSKTSKMSLLS